MVWQVVRFAVAFAAVLALAAWATRWLAGQARGMRRPAFAVLGGLALGGQRQVCAVRVGRRVLILGLADRQVSLLQTITDPEEIALLEAPTVPPAGSGAALPGGFAAALRRAWRQQRSGARDPRQEGRRDG